MRELSLESSTDAATEEDKSHTPGISESAMKPSTAGHDPIHTKILLTSLSAMVAETSTFPIDLTKTRLPLLHGGPSAANTFRVAGDILRHQGLFGLYQGLSPTLIRHLFYTPIRIVGYEHLRNLVLASADDDAASIFLSTKALVTGLSGAMSQIVAGPDDLVKVRMQADGHLLHQGLQPRYCGPMDALSKIIREEGFRGFWKGVVPNIQRAFLVNMGELACYDHAKRFVIHHQIADDTIYARTLALIMSGLSATTLSCPTDVVKTRMMNQAAKKRGDTVMYRNSYDFLVKTTKLEGVSILGKVFFPTWARLGPWQFVFWVSYERFWQLAVLSSF